ncbi:MAG: hypothetical protein ACREYE_22610 [Gammaproteobacteria bacterium]
MATSEHPPVLRRLCATEVCDPARHGYVAGARFILWRAPSGIGGLTLWGDQSEAQALKIVRICSDTLRAPGVLDRSHAFTALLDLRRFGQMDLSAFSTFDAWPHCLHVLHGSRLLSLRF